MRRHHHTLVCLSLLATAACTLDSVTGPQAVPVSEMQASAARADDPASATQRGPEQVWINPLGPEALIIVDGVIQQEAPHLMATEIADVQIVRGKAGLRDGVGRT
ncbi:MAG TPA: hypothetical protein VGC13_03940 [Longimicrobium sp.]|jgi:hypothetical protein|uniref:hypothetical protein n=1 Tax=Longimicrobium sp. TaxID=2029185 RepID=UPI002ED8A9A2